VAESTPAPSQATAEETQCSPEFSVKTVTASLGEAKAELTPKARDVRLTGNVSSTLLL